MYCKKKEKMEQIKSIKIIACVSLAASRHTCCRPTGKRERATEPANLSRPFAFSRGPTTSEPARRL